MTLTSKLNASERLNTILKESFNPIMKKHNFKKKGNKHTLELDNLTYVVNIYKSRWNTKENMDFRIEWGVLLNEDKKKPEVPFKAEALGGSHYHLFSYDHLLSHPIPQWFSINENDENQEKQDATTKETITYVLKDAILPFLLSFHTIQDIIDFLEKTPNTPKDSKRSVPLDGGQTLDWLASLYYFIGQPQKSIEILEEAIKSAKVTSFKKNLEDLKKIILDHMKT